MIKKLLPKNSYCSPPAARDNCVNELILYMKMHKISSNLPVLAVVLMCTLLIVACDKEQPQTPVSAPAQPPQAAIQPKPVQGTISSALRIPQAPSNQFDFSNKKDPFKPFVTAKPSVPNTALALRNARRNLLPIQSFDVSQFKLIGIISAGSEKRAMVTDPGGKGYVLKVGTLIGKNDGKVISITSGGVDILEQFRDDNGRVRKSKIKLTLPRKQ